MPTTTLPNGIIWSYNPPTNPRCPFCGVGLLANRENLSWRPLHPCSHTRTGACMTPTGTRYIPAIRGKSGYLSTSWFLYAKGAKSKPPASSILSSPNFMEYENDTKSNVWAAETTTLNEQDGDEDFSSFQLRDFGLASNAMDFTDFVNDEFQWPIHDVPELDNDQIPSPKTPQPRPSKETSMAKTKGKKTDGKNDDGKVHRGRGRPIMNIEATEGLEVCQPYRPEPNPSLTSPAPPHTSQTGAKSVSQPQRVQHRGAEQAMRRTDLRRRQLQWSLRRPGQAEK